MVQIDPVAYFSSSFRDKPDLPRQGSLSLHNQGVLQFLPGKNYEQALEDLKGIDRIWIVFWMHKVSSWRAKIQPPRSVSKKGVFATRSPHRPNPIGLSCVRLVSVTGLNLVIEGHDLLDGTPVLDVKPYLPYADSFPDAGCGWLDEMASLSPNKVIFSTLALEQVSFLEKSGLANLSGNLEERLRFFSEETSCNRIEKLSSGLYLQAYKSWRLIFQKGKEITVLVLFSGYEQKALDGALESVWGDLSLHRAFLKLFERDIKKCFNDVGFLNIYLGGC